MSMPIRLLLEFIKQDVKSPVPRTRGDEIAIYISTWLNTPVPWYDPAAKTLRSQNPKLNVLQAQY